MLDNLSQSANLFDFFLILVLPLRFFSVKCTVHFTTGRSTQGWLVYLNNENKRRFLSRGKNIESVLRNAYKFCIRSTIPNCRRRFTTLTKGGEEVNEFVIFHPESPADMKANYDPQHYRGVRQRVFKGFSHVSPLVEAHGDPNEDPTEPEQDYEEPQSPNTEEYTESESEHEVKQEDPMDDSTESIEARLLRDNALLRQRCFMLEQKVALFEIQQRDQLRYTPFTVSSQINAYTYDQPGIISINELLRFLNPHQY